MPTQKDVSRIVSLTQGFSGAEIEKVVEASLVDAFADNPDEPVLEGKHLVEASSSIIPQARLNKEEIETSRMWSQGRCKLAQQGEPVKLEGLAVDRQSIINTRRINLN